MGAVHLADMATLVTYNRINLPPACLSTPAAEWWAPGAPQDANCKNVAETVQHTSTTDVSMSK